ncbi:hypothetical protein I79_025894 [Cricetulus griseus]|uniref:Uncharacterized protein n=1 Tax=Cricetulus griseus TaxID=10029 RepID=G3IPI3_CRIGR|nr:hypothetical protein I79_025894 [Cricetulus griseus]
MQSSCLASRGTAGAHQARPDGVGWIAPTAREALCRGHDHTKAVRTFCNRKRHGLRLHSRSTLSESSGCGLFKKAKRRRHKPRPGTGLHRACAVRTRFRVLVLGSAICGCGARL